MELAEQSKLIGPEHSGVFLGLALYGTFNTYPKIT